MLPKLVCAGLAMVKVSFLFRNGKFYVAHVGDSRAVLSSKSKRSDVAECYNSAMPRNSLQMETDLKR